MTFKYVYQTTRGTYGALYSARKLIKNDKYIETENKYLLSTRELNTTTKFNELMKSDISSFKIEGRMKSPSYVGYITRIYRKLIDNYKLDYIFNKCIVVFFIIILPYILYNFLHLPPYYHYDLQLHLIL